MNNQAPFSRIVKKTADGWPTLYVAEIDETYHSCFGARTEAQHIFIHHGLEALPHKTNLCVFEVGFGTGLNAFEACIWAQKNAVHVNYHTIEKYILSSTDIRSLDIENYINTEEYSTFMNIHECSWNTHHTVNNYFNITKISEDIRKYSNFPQNIDVVFFDAFSPEKQSDVWTSQIFASLYAHMNHRGILTTYCVKGDIKRTLKNVGFHIEKLAGPPGGKREILRAKK